MGTDDGGKMEMDMQKCSIKRTGVSKEQARDQIEWMLRTKMAELKYFNLGDMVQEKNIHIFRNYSMSILNNDNNDNLEKDP